MARLTPEQLEKGARARRAGFSVREAARQADCSASQISTLFPDSWVREQNGEVDEAAPQDGLATEKQDVTEYEDGSRHVEIVSRKPIRTEKDVIEHGEIDMSVYKIRKAKFSSWEVPVKMRGAVKADGTREADRQETIRLWGVKLDLDRIVRKELQDGISLAVQGFTSEAYRLDPPNIVLRPPGRHMMEISMPDVHLGKLCWGQETGHDYDLKIAERIYRNGLSDHVARARWFELDKIVMTIGSDFFHYDTPGGTTTAGTPLDRDGRFPKMFDLGVKLKNWAVSVLLEACNEVELKWIEGNHDAISSLCLAHAVNERYYHDSRVTVDLNADTRKYVRYGVNLIGHTHGDGIKLQDLPLIMAHERKADWAETVCREWHLGHFHTSKTFQTKPVNEHVGVEVIVVPSPCGTDAWHHKHGFVGNTRASRSFVYDKEIGKVATFNAPARI